MSQKKFTIIALRSSYSSRHDDSLSLLGIKLARQAVNMLVNDFGIFPQNALVTNSACAQATALCMLDLRGKSPCLLGDFLSDDIYFGSGRLSSVFDSHRNENLSWQGICGCLDDDVKKTFHLSLSTLKESFISNLQYLPSNSKALFISRGPVACAALGEDFYDLPVSPCSGVLVQVMVDSHSLTVQSWKNFVVTSQ